jgi:hypothetical protein
MPRREVCDATLPLDYIAIFNDEPHLYDFTGRRSESMVSKASKQAVNLLTGKAISDTDN